MTTDFSISPEQPLQTNWELTYSKRNEQRRKNNSKVKNNFTKSALKTNKYKGTSLHRSCHCLEKTKHIHMSTPV